MTLRAVDIEGLQATRPTDPGARPEFVDVRIDALRIDDAYQRPLNEKGRRAIRRIAEAFRWSLFQPVVIARITDQTFALIDGQHRAHAAALAGFERIPAMLVDAAPDAQARAFSVLNTERTAVSPLQLFRAAKAAGEDWALAADRAVADAECRLMDYNKSAAHRRPREVFCVALIRNHVRAGRAQLVTNALAGLLHASAADDVALWSVAFLRPWLDALALAGADDANQIAAFAAATDLRKLQRRAALLKSQPEFERETVVGLATRSIRLMFEHFRAGGRDAA